MNAKMVVMIALVYFLAIDCKAKAKENNPEEKAPVHEPSALIPKPTTPPEPVITQPPVRKSSAYFFKGSSLHRFGNDGEIQTLATSTPIHDCVVDTVHDAFWIVGATGLLVYDVQTQRLSPIVPTTTSNPIDAFEVRFGDGKGIVGNADGLADMAAVVVMATAGEVSIRSEVICDGDLSMSCFLMEEDEGDDPDLWEQTDELKALVARYNTLRLANKALLTTISGRKKKADSPQNESPPLPKVALDKSTCEEVPEDCGTGEYLGHGYWSMIVGNSRGDFYHETHALYDSKTSEWVTPKTGERSKVLKDLNFSLGHVSSDQASILTEDGIWYSLRDNQIIKSLSEDARFCGFGPTAVLASSDKHE